MDICIENLAVSLKSSFDAKDDKEATNVLNSLHNLIEDDITARTVDTIISEIFNDSYSLLQFLDDAKNDKRWNGANTITFTILHDLFSHFYNHLNYYILSTIRTCKSVTFSGTDYTLKCKALDLVHLILKKECIINDEIIDTYKQLRRFIFLKNNNGSQTVLGKMFSLLGYITLKYPLIVDNEDELTECYVTHLQNEINSQRDAVVKGLLYGLGDLLQVFPIDNVNDTKICKIIYNSLKMTIETQKAHSKTHQKAAMQFIINHCQVIIEYMYEIPIWWHEKLQSWLEYENEYRKIGYFALEVFFKEIASLLELKSEDTSIFNYFYKYFNDTLKLKEVDNSLMRSTIRGYGLFSAACKKHISQDEVVKMFYKIVQQVENIYFLKEQNEPDELELLSDYIFCISAVLYNVDNVHDDQIIMLQQLSILMIKNFPKLSTHYHPYISKSMVSSMCCLFMRNTKLFDEYIRIVIYQGMLWTCSHKMQINVDLSADEPTHEITYKKFMPLWLNILKLNITSPNYDYPRNVLAAVSRKYFNELMSALFVLINKLNFEIKLKRLDVPVTDLEFSYEATKEDDLVIFINAVDFYKDILSNCDATMFKTWVKHFVKHIITKSIQNPLISGFYKLLTSCLQLCAKIDYFEDKYKSENVQMSYDNILRFLETLLSNIQYYKGELQLACLQLTLAIPNPMVIELLPLITTALKIIFTIGRNNLKLAEDGIDALQKWNKHFPRNELQHSLKTILPYLDSYLQSKEFDGDPDTSIPLLQKKRKRKRKIYIERDSQLFILQKKILVFVGQLNAELSTSIVDSTQTINSVTLENITFLKFTLPFLDAMPEIYFDVIAPRVIELALHSSDPQTKTVASELFQAIVVCYLGMSRQVSPTKSNQLSKLFQVFAMPLLELACDTQVSELFSSFFYQIIHWFTNPKQLYSAETKILIETLMDGVSHPTNTAVKDFSGKCIKEFIQWTIIQMKEKDLEQYPHNIRSMVNDICMYCLHPNPHKRLGAALAFNNMYVTLREELSMVDIFWIELAYSFIMNLSLGNSVEIDNKQVLAALDHIERVFREKHRMFNETNATRRVPSDIKGGLLKDVVLWILEKTASPNAMCKDKCRGMFKALVPCVNGCTTFQDFIAKYISGDKWYLELYERGLLNIPSQSDAHDFIEWLNNLYCCTDSYNWLINEHVISINDVIGGGQFYRSITYFIDICLSNADKSTCFATDVNDYNNLKRKIVTNILDISIVTLRNNVQDVLIFNVQLWNVICKCIFNPYSLNFDVSNNNAMDRLYATLKSFLDVLSNSNMRDEFSMIVGNYFDINYKSYALTVMSIPLEQRLLLKGWLLILRSDLGDDFRKNYKPINVKDIFDGIVKNLKIHSTVQEYVSLHLTIEFLIVDNVSLVCECLQNQTKVLHGDSGHVTYGQLFYNTFKDVLTEYLLKNIVEVVTYLSRKRTVNSMNIIMNLMKVVLEDKNTKYDKSQFVKVIMNCESFFDAFDIDSFADRTLQIELMLNVIRLTQEPIYMLGERHAFIKGWFYEHLLYKDFTTVPKQLFQYKMKVLAIVSCMTGPNDDDNHTLQDKLKVFKQNFMVGYEKEIWDDTDVIILLNKLFDYLKLSKSRIVLHCIAEFIMGMKSYEGNINMSKKLQLYLVNLSTDHQYKSLELIYRMCCNPMYTVDQRYKLAKQFLPGLIQNINQDAFQLFYVNYIKKIVNILKDDILDAQNKMDLLANKIISFMLIEHLFGRIDVSKFTDKSCPITKSLTDKIVTGTELSKALTDIAVNMRKDVLALDSDDIKELYRLYHCSAYNATISIISNCKKQEQEFFFYDILFSGNIWHNIIDCSKPISVPLEYNTLPMRIKKFVNIRSEKNDSQPIKYIESQTLFNSTLCEDVHKFDFTNTIMRTEGHQENNIELKQLELQAVDINEHECMATMCVLIQHMADLKIIGEPKAKLPICIDKIRNILLNEKTQLNVKIFFARLIRNVEHLMKSYATVLIEPIMKFIIDGCIGNNINYFTADLIEMLITWTDESTLSTYMTHGRGLVKFLADNIYSDRRNIFKYNLEIMKTVVEKWKSVIEVPSDLILKKLKTSPLVGVQLTGVFLANDMIPWTNENKNDFLKAVLGLLRDDNHEVYKSASEVVGMTMKYTEDNGQTGFYDKLMMFVSKILKGMQDDRFLHVLDHIQMHYVNIIDSYLADICLKLIRQRTSSLKLIGLKSVLKRVQQNANTVVEILKEYNELLSDPNVNIQLVTLQIINEMVGFMPLDQLSPVLNIVFKFKSNIDPLVRSTMYQIVISTYKKYNMESCKSVLLLGLIDSDPNIQKMIEQFWLDDHDLPLSLSQRYLTILQSMYSSNTESYYLGYSINFLLEACKKTPTYNTKLFEYELDDCSYEDHKLLIQWRAQNASLIPMFVNSFVQDCVRDFAPELIGIRTLGSYREFDPTQMGPIIQSVTDSSSTLLFNSSTKFREARTTNVPSTDRSEFQTVRNYSRYMSDKNKEKKYFALKAVAINNRIDELRKNKKKLKEERVVLYRKYRIGDLPDISILKSEIIQLLQVLAKRDGIIARHLYVMLFKGFVSSKNDNERYLEQVGACVTEIFNQSYMFIPSMIGALLDISYHYQKNIYIEPKLLVSTCKNSGLLSMGSLLLEEYIMSRLDEPKSQKRGCGSVDAGLNPWIELANLYKEMNEWDMVTGIFSDKLDCSDEVLKGINAEANGEWEKALNYYDSLIVKDSSSSRKQYYYESCFTCYANLSDWNSISTYTEKVGLDDMWDGEWNQNVLLPWFFTSQLYLMCDDENKQIPKQLRNWLTDPEKSNYIRDKFSEQLAVMALMKNDTHAAKNYIYYYFNQFLEEFSNINPLYYKVRRNKILDMQKIIDINKYLDFNENAQQNNYSGLLSEMISDWKTNNDLYSYQMYITEFRTIYRKLAISLVQQHVTNFTSNEVQARMKELNKLKIFADLSLIDNSLNENNRHIARKYFKKNLILTKSKDTLEGFQSSIIIGKMGALLSEQVQGFEKYKKLVKIFKQLDSGHSNIVQNNCSKLSIESAIQMFDITQKLHQLLQSDVTLNVSEIKGIKHDINSPLDIQNYGKRLLSDAITALETENESHHPYFVQGYTTLIHFLHDRREQDNYNYATFVLRAMKYGSEEAKQLFPCLFHLNDSTQNYVHLLVKETSDIPTWMFLPWIPQLLANLTTEFSKVSEMIITKIADQYPQAIMYNYRLSKDNLKMGEPNDIITHLDNMLENAHINKLLSAFSLICIPEKKVLCYMNNLVNYCHDITKLHNYYQFIFKDIFTDSQDMQGILYNKSKPFQKFCTFIKEFPKLKIDPADLKNYLEQKRGDLIHHIDVKHSNYKFLKNYSVWLANFKSLYFNYEIEIPGQYKGDRKPLCQYHTKIWSFLPEVKIFNSKWKPIKITILGNDAKEYPFIIKFGEDLRQDQRIQQLCTLANKILSKDKGCRQRNLAVETYEVVPLTSHLGLIEFACNTDLITFVSSALSDNKVLEKVAIKQDLWMTKVCKGAGEESVSVRYGKSCVALSKNDVVVKFTEFAQSIPWDVLRTAFWKISINMEAFVSLRSQFVTSYSTMCIVNWIFGIGDRHLSNILIEEKSGKVTGIDFGCAFGAATQNLPIPELVPFRLTPHILFLMEPFKETGLIKQSMIYALKALRKDKNTILSTMNVFIQEPTIDWFNIKNRDYEITTIDDQDSNQKLIRVNRKLDGVNPVVITEDEVQCGILENADFKKAYINALVGCPGDVRRKMGKDGLSAEEQVDCLIDQATDYNILGRMYRGFQAWV